VSRGDDVDAAADWRRARPAAANAIAAPSVPSPKSALLEEEVRLLGEGRSMLDADPTRAPSAAEMQASRYPNGQLRLERELLAVDALERLGRGDAARARARAVLPSARGSLYDARFRVRAGVDR
jgi:exonuclease VII large subunit